MRAKGRVTRPKSKMFLKDFLVQVNSSFWHTLTIFGKRGCQVHVLMSIVEEDVIKMLKGKKSVISTADGNLFIFACPNSALKNSLRGNEDMHKVLNCIEDLQNPERIRSRELRKHCATVTQITDLTEGDLQWLADHLGHNLNVHKRVDC